jgi:hypothetical protein
MIPSDDVLPGELDLMEEPASRCGTDDVHAGNPS